MAHPGGEVGDLREALTALHALVGAPTDRQLAAYASLAGCELPRATANTVRRGQGTPRRETVEAFVAACLRFAKKHKPPIPVPAEYTDMSLWRKRCENFTAASNSVRADKAQNKIASAAELPGSLNSPVRLLDPSNRVVEFIGRTAELEDLLDWCNDDSKGRLRLITGPGGIGKTRLALQLTRHLETLHWQCVWVGDRHEAHILADIRAVSKGAVFLVVDYAETRIRLDELLHAVAADSGTIRLLLLARSAGQWWEQLAHCGRGIRELVAGAGPEGTRLGQVLDEHIKDEEEVLRAVPVFAAALGVTPPDHVIVTAQAGRARILELHAAALVAVLEWIEDPRDPKEEPLVRLSGILDELLLHEGHFWLGSASAWGPMPRALGIWVSVRVSWFWLRWVAPDLGHAEGRRRAGDGWIHGPAGW